MLSQIAIGVGVALLDLVLHFKERLYFLLRGLHAIQCGKFFFLHFRAIWKDGLGARFNRLRTKSP